MALELIVLDCDGVILESVDVKTRAFGRLFEEHGPRSVQRFVDYHLAHGGVSRFEKFAWYFREVLGREITEAQSRELGERFTRYCYEGVVAAPFVPGALEFLEVFHRVLPLCVASGTPHGELTEIFKARDLLRYFQTVRGTPPGKTGLLAGIVRDSGVAPEAVLMVGDSSTDQEAAEAVGTLFYGRGLEFEGSSWPWGADLTGLGAHVRALLPGPNPS